MQASPIRAAVKVMLGAALLGARVAHLTIARREFQAQVPDWVPANPDTVVVASGIAEVALGTATLAVWRQPWRRRIGQFGALFFTAIFPGNIAQYTERRDAFGLDTDRKRFARLFMQPLLVWTALAGGRT